MQSEKTWRGRIFEMRRICLRTTLFCVGLFLLAAPMAKATDLSALPSDLRIKVEDLIATRFPPELHEITLDPAEPVAGQPTKITVKIYNNAQVTSDTVSNVDLLWWVNWDGDWQSVEMESEDEKIWTAELPGFNSGDEVVYAIRAADGSGNTFTTIPCMVNADDEIMSKSDVTEDCVNTAENNDFSACESVLPKGCLMKMAIDEDPLNDEDDLIQKYGDYLDYRIGYDETSIYIDLATEGNIDKGTMTPTDIHIYVGLILNPDKMGNDSSIDGLLDAGAVMVYAPLLKQFESTGYVSDCFFGYAKGGQFAMDTKSVKCMAKMNHLVFKISREALKKFGDNPSSTYQFLVAGAVVTDIQDFNDIKGTLLDYTHITAANFTEDYYFEVP